MHLAPWHAATGLPRHHRLFERFHKDAHARRDHFVLYLVHNGGLRIVHARSLYPTAIVGIERGRTGIADQHVPVKREATVAIGPGPVNPISRRMASSASLCIVPTVSCGM